MQHLSRRKVNITTLNRCTGRAPRGTTTEVAISNLMKAFGNTKYSKYENIRLGFIESVQMCEIALFPLAPPTLIVCADPAFIVI